MQNATVEYRKVVPSDFDSVCVFVDKWLSGRAVKEGGGNDYFVSRAQQREYFAHCHVYLGLVDGEIIAWGVKERTGVLIHLLVNPHYRGQGIGKEMMKRMSPDIVRSKTDQMTGNPKTFYEQCGYKSVSNSLVGKKKNIEFMTR